MVSTAMAVFPVCLSPMINSLCPLPMGTRPSTALRPVCIGSLTDFLGMIPGALISTLDLLVVLTGPRPSMGLPRASKTLPNISSPMGTSTMAPVLLTVSPSWISLELNKFYTCRYRRWRHRHCQFPSWGPYLWLRIWIRPFHLLGLYWGQRLWQYRHRYWWLYRITWHHSGNEIKITTWVMFMILSWMTLAVSAMLSFFELNMYLMFIKPFMILIFPINKYQNLHLINIDLTHWRILSFAILFFEFIFWGERLFQCKNDKRLKPIHTILKVFPFKCIKIWIARLKNVKLDFLPSKIESKFVKFTSKGEIWLAYHWKVKNDL